MAAELTNHQSLKGLWSFRFRASYGRTVASGHGYSTVGDMRRGIEGAETAVRLTRKDLKRRDAWG